MAISSPGVAKADELLSLLGAPSEDPRIEALWDRLRTKRRPEYDPENPDSFFAWVLVRRQGVELGFVDQVYLTAGEPWRRRRPGVPKILWQVYFYRMREEVNPYAGELPFGLVWTDSRATIHRKLAAYEATRRSYIMDTWTVPAFRISVEYKGSRQSMSSIVCFLEAAPWPEEGRVQPKIEVAEWIQLLRLPADAKTLRNKLQPLDLKGRIERDDDDHEVDFRKECGLELIFLEAKYLKRNRQMARFARDGMVLGGVRFYRSRELDAREWTGPLPFGLQFDDTPDRMVEKLGRDPDDREDEGLGGYAFWEFSEYCVHVLYSNLKNHLLRITLLTPER